MTDSGGQRPGGPPVGKAEQARRAERIEELYLDHGAVEPTIRAAKRELSVGRRTVERYLQRLRRRWFAEDDAERPARIAKHRRRLLSIIRQARETGRLGAAVQAERLLAEIDGVRHPEEHVVRVETDLTRLTDVELAAMRTIREKLDAPALPGGNGNGRAVAMLEAEVVEDDDGNGAGG